jgi:hypothetical protein
MGRLLGWLRGGSDELGWDDLIRRISEEVAELASWAARGEIEFPGEVVVTIAVGESQLEVVRGFLVRPELDREIDSALANRCDCPPERLPAREYRVVAAKTASVTAAAAPPRAWELEIEGGDRSGQTLAVPAARPELRFGRGPWHGPEHQLRNDLIVCDSSQFVSRRAGRLLCSGSRLEVEALDQGDSLVVRRPGGETLRPARTARNRVALASGDAIELADRGGAAVRLVLRRSREGSDE